MQLGLLFQIIEKAGKIPWDSITLPEGRTQKACVVMIDKEKQKVRKAREADGEGGQEGAGEGEKTPKAGAKVGIFTLRFICCLVRTCD